MVKQRSLVLQHLENVSGRVLDQYPVVIRKMIHRRAGIYVLYRKDKLYYVGLASNLMGRLKRHLKDRHRGYWDHFSVYLTIDDQHTKELESLLLRITGPSGNRTGGRFIDSRNLRPVLNREMSEHDKDERAILLGGQLARRRMRSKSKRGTGTVQLAEMVDRRIALRATYHQQKYRATLRKDGYISFGRKLYESPSGAARAATGKGATNGWVFWRYRSKGKWIPLSNIRK